MLLLESQAKNCIFKEKGEKKQNSGFGEQHIGEEQCRYHKK